MSPKPSQFYEFANFRLDPAQKLLLRDGEPVSLTPKVFDTLEVLVENAGQLLEKGYLMESLWQDHFVEESNLTTNIKLIRKALGDNAAWPRFIETVPRRGYKFIAKVTELPLATGVPIESPPTPTKKNEAYKGYGLILKLITACSLFAVVGIVFAGAWYGWVHQNANAPILTAPFTSERLSTNGKVLSAAISPDGKMVVYTDRSGGKQSVWLRQLDTANNVQIIPASDDSYYEFAFTPDGRSLYFARRARSLESQGNIYRISILGGIPTKIVSDAQGWLSLSPDGEKISFVRCFYRDDEFCSLWIADAADGANERKLASRKRPFRITDNKISPDGKSIAFATGQSENAANEFGVAKADIKTSAEMEMSAEHFFNIKHLAWLPDQSGLLITAAKIPNKQFRIWQISTASGKAWPLTSDAETYSVLSLDKAADALVTTRIEEDFRLFLFPMDDPGVGQPLAEATKFTFASDGNIVFSSSMSGNREIWSMDQDGTGRRQLTNDPADDFDPLVSLNNASVFFSSNRTGLAQVWQMNLDGSNQRQLTHEVGGFPLSASPDGEWVYYHNALDRTLWRVSLKNGNEQLVSNRSKYFYSLSPDGTMYAYTEKVNGSRSIVIASLASGDVVRSIPYRDQGSRILDLEWTADGSSIAYVAANNEFEQNALWLQPIDNGKPHKIADLGDEEISQFALAPDGKSFAITKGGWKHDAFLLKGLH